MSNSQVRMEPECLMIDLSGEQRCFNYFWLRDNSPQSRSPNGQRLHESNAIDRNIRPESAQIIDEILHVIWPDDHVSDFPLEFLERHSGDHSETPVYYWDAGIADEIGRYDYNEVSRDNSARRAWLSDVERLGFSVLSNVPTAEGTILDVVRLFGFVRETNYGRFFEVQAEERPSNLAYTPIPLSVHTDNPYRDPCPTLQLLHCLVQAEQGGITAVVDGFNAAQRLREKSPDAFRLLTSTDVTFRYESDDAILKSTGPIISLDGNGEPKRIRINNRSMAPLSMPCESVRPFYDALFAFREILEDDGSQFRFRLEPGDLIILDNERVLHGRAGESIGARHLQGCYSDRDGLLSTLRVLERDGD